MRYAQDQGDKSYDPNGDIRSKKNTMITILLIAGIVLFIMALISFALKMKYKGVTGRQAADFLESNKILDHMSTVRSPHLQSKASAPQSLVEGGQLSPDPNSDRENNSQRNILPDDLADKFSNRV